MGQMGLILSNNKFKYKHILSSKSLLTYHSSCIHNFNYLWHMGLTLHTDLEKHCIYHVAKYCTAISPHSISIVNLLIILFFETPGTLRLRDKLNFRGKLTTLTISTTELDIQISIKSNRNNTQLKNNTILLTVMNNGHNLPLKTFKEQPQ